MGKKSESRKEVKSATFGKLQKGPAVIAGPAVTPLPEGLSRPKGGRPYVVNNGVSTLEESDRKRYSDAELKKFEENILLKIKETRQILKDLKASLSREDNGTTDTDPHNMGMEDGSDTLHREQTAYEIGRMQKHLQKLDLALLRIKNKTYGVCSFTGRLISKGRLMLVPHATSSIEAKVAKMA